MKQIRKIVNVEETAVCLSNSNRTYRMLTLKLETITLIQGANFFLNSKIQCG